MSYTQLRRLSIASVKDVFKRLIPVSGAESQQVLTSLPHVTGAGAFIEHVSYQILGSSHNLLNINLPKSSILNIRYSNKKQKIVALNGKISSLYTELTKLDSNIVFQRCFNQTEPMSLLIAQNSENSNFAMVETNKDYWKLKRNSLFAWSGPSIEPHAIKHSQFVQIKGEGNFIVSSPGQILQLILAENESIHINQSAIVGYTFKKDVISGGDDGFTSSNMSVVNLSSGKIAFLTYVATFTNHLKLPNSLMIDPSFEKFRTFLTKVNSPIKKSICYIKSVLPKVNQKELFVELKGPKTILLSNYFQMCDKSLTTEQIKS
ncbi:hypothetical protein CANINC_001656 [Pichia inconspicua]|uniref:Altered inheritance of mitochondria protein 24, mitochondrial n=1 Tax=Pichia inconspicua TaxID=52247 RepID=A0A4T0X343_9ASCO|nr:hypothetical protein CANINC_001656 [[Candida] inconspicua]